MKRAFTLPCALALAGALVTVGCGTEKVERPETVPVSGTIMYNGEPVGSANVIFRHKDGQSSSYGKTDAQGRFQLQTFEANDGARPGEYVVSVQKYEITKPELPEEHPDYVPPPPPKPLVPEKYMDPKTSGLTANVQDAENNFNFDLKD